MNSVEIYIVVEGQSEQTFVRDVLAPQIAHKGIYLHSALIGKPGHKSGDIRLDKKFAWHQKPRKPGAPGNEWIGMANPGSTSIHV